MQSSINIGGTQIRVEGTVLRIARPDADKYQQLEDPASVLDGLRESKSRVDLFTFMQIMPLTTPQYSYSMEWDNLAVLPVSTFDHWWNHQIRSFPRNRARQAEKRGATIRETTLDDSLVRGIWEVYNECPVRQGRRFRHYGKDIETVRREEATYLDSSVFIGAFLGDKLIGFAKLTWDQTRTQANLMNILSMVQHRDKAPTNAIIAQAVRSCAERNIRYLVYQNFSYGNKPPDSMTNFKEVNGFTRVDVPRYYVPLTPLGLAALRCGFHKGPAEWVPEPIVAKLRELRSVWYKRRLESVAELS
jgi:hypothetical protein